MKKRMYVWINVIVIFLSSIYCIRMISTLGKESLTLNVQTIALLFAVLLCVFFIFLFKFLRIYLIFLEKRFPLTRFIRIFIKSTFIMLCLPFKCGEFFRMYNYSCEVNEYHTGIFAVILDRYFDTVALLIILIPLELSTIGALSFVSILLSIFIVLISVVYCAFLPTSHYLNKYLIFNVSSRKGIACLKLLDKCEDGYFYLSGLMKNRVTLLLVLSFMPWGLEFLSFKLLSMLFNSHFSVLDFSQYLSSIFIGNDNHLVSVFTTIGAFLLAFITFLIYGISYMKRVVNKQ